MTLNGKMALILRYFAEFGILRGTLRKSGWQSHNYGQFMISMSSAKRLQRDRATPTVEIFYNYKVQGVMWLAFIKHDFLCAFSILSGGIWVYLTSDS